MSASATAGATAPASTRAVASLVLGVLGTALACVFSPFAIALGWTELVDIRDGRAPAAGRSLAQVGMILGIVQATDEEKASAKVTALMASRTNTLLSIPMLMCMVGHAHGLPY